MLFGSNQTYLTKLKAEFNKHPWTTRANFLHFPKIEILPSDFIVVSVSLAGASELVDNIHFIDIDRDSKKKSVTKEEPQHRQDEEELEQKHDQDNEIKKDKDPLQLINSLFQ